MGRILGIDLGTNSIGWAIVDKDNGTTKLIDKGVNIFQEGVAREKNVEKPRVQERTQARASRRHYFRRRLRKIELLKVLVSEKLCPFLPEEALREWKENKKYPLDDAFIKWLRTDEPSGDNPYADRYRCLTEKLNFDIQADRYCFGRAMYHIVQRRGFLSNRKDSSNDTESGKVKKDISNLSTAIHNSGCEYLGEYFYKLYQNPDKSSAKIRCNYTSRNEHYKAEFDRICQVQGISDELKEALEKAIFYQRPLKSQKGSVGKCTFEKNKARCPISHPRFEEFRMWQYINSIKVKGPDDTQLRMLSEKEVISILPLFLRKSKMSFDFEDIEKKIAGKGNYGYIDEEKQVLYRFNYREKAGVTGCPVLGGILSFLGKDNDYQNWDSDIAAIYMKADGKSVDQIVNDLWHALFSFTDDEILTEWLEKNFQTTEERAKALATKTKVPSGYASLSLKAISKILPFLKEGYRYDQAVVLAGVENVFVPSRRQNSSLLSKAQKAVCDEFECIAAGIVSVDAKKGKYVILQDLLRDNFAAEHPERLYHPSMIEIYPQAVPDKNGVLKLGSPRVASIKNPMAMRALFRLRALINELLAKGIIDRNTKINIEFARGLNNANVRKAIEAYQRDRENKRAKYRASIIEDFKIGAGMDIIPTEDDILKYQLWEEQRHICLYTGNEINLTDFIGDHSRYDIEHTVPKSRGGDNSDMNKTLCLNVFNRDVKKSKLPSELANHSEVLARIESLQWQKKIDDLRFQIDCRRRDARSAETKESKDIAIQRMHQLRMELDYWKGKYDRFTMKTVSEGFSNRQGVDIGIIGRYARLYLQSVFNKIYVVKGATTAEFRKAWGIQDEYEKKSRDSHSHHCVDAITIACIGKEEYDRWKIYSEQNDRFVFGDGPKPLFEKPWSTFSEDVKAVADEILVSHTTPDNMGKQSKKRVRINGKLQYGPDGQKLYEQGVTARGSLNKATFYGAIDCDGEIKYVVRKAIDVIQESDVKNIVDTVVRQKVLDAIAEKGFKKAVSEPIWMNEEKHIPIKKVRLFTNVTSPSILKKQRDLSDKEYKRNYYVMNDGNYCMAVYGNQTKKPSFKLYSNLEAARLFNSGNRSFIPESDDKGLPLSFVLKPGTMVLFYEKTPQEIYACSYEELSKRLYKVMALSSMLVSGKYLFGTIVLRHHLESRIKKDLKSKNGLWKIGEQYRPIVGINHNQLRCLVEGYDFKLGVDGKVTFPHK
ncbi:MAG: CRISPR-associated protein Csn1 [Bacteroidales bacterium]|nr:CRISPR-associated protein Csn1 [Bacteroidales bacterium]